MKEIEEKPGKPVNPIDYFYNEQGDHTITLHGEPLCYVKKEKDAIKLRNSMAALTLRIDVLSKMEATLRSENDKLRELLSKLHGNTVYKLGPGDDRETHAPYEWFDEIEKLLTPKD